MTNNVQERKLAKAPSTIATMDAMGWGVFFIWIGVALIVDVGWGVALLGVGLIALAIQLLRRLSALPVDPWGVGMGGCLSLAGLLIWLDLLSRRPDLSAWVVPIAFVVIGVSIVFSAWSRRGD